MKSGADILDKQRRKNRGGRLPELALKSFIPLLLAVLFVGNGSVSSVAKTLLYASAAVSFTDMAGVHGNGSSDGEFTETFSADKIHQKGALGNSYPPSEKESDTPSDILALIADAEKKYADSSNDGKIIEADYSSRNATSEYNGVYLRNTTKSHSVDISDYLNRKVQANIIGEGPSVFIYHTHTTETYELLDRGFYTKERSSRSENPAENMIRIGDEVCKTLEKNGFQAIHDKTIYDTQYSGAYDRSREAVKKALTEYPTIQIVIDIHRDAIYQKDGSRIKPVTEINGKKAAQIMIVSGCEDGNVTGFPNWEKNLTFAVALQNQLSKDNPRIMRPLLFCGRKYNMDIMSCSLAVEFGSDANTLSEAVYSAELFGISLGELLKEYKK